MPALQRMVGRRTFQRNFLITSGVIVVALVVGWRHIVPTLRNWKAIALNRKAGQLIESDRSLEARDALLNAIKRNPKRAESWRLYARLLERLGDPQSAYAEYRAHELNPSDEPQAVRALRACLEKGHLDMAETLSAQLQKAFPKSADTWHLSGMLAAVTGDTVRAQGYLRKALALAPNNVNIRLSLAAVQAVSADPTQAAEGAAMLSALRQEPEVAESAALSLAAAVASTNRLAAARLLYQIPAGSTNDWSGTLQRLDLLAETDTASTSSEILRLWPLAPDLPSRISLLWRCLIDVGPESASALHEKLPPEERDSIQGLLFKTELEARAGHWAEVIRLVTSRVNELLPPGDALLINLVQLRAHTALENHPAARQARDRITDIAETDAALSQHVGLILESWELPDEAATFYETAARNGTGPVRRDALLRLAGIYETARDASRALRTTERLLQDSPDDPVHRNNLAAYLLVLGRQDARTLPYSKLAHEAVPGSVEFADTHARALAASGRVTEALAIYDKLPAEALALPVLKLNRALTLRDAGRVDEARTLVEGMSGDALFPEQRMALDKLRGTAPAPAPAATPAPTVPVVPGN